MGEYIIAEGFNMDKYIFDKNNGLWYKLQSDYYIPCLSLPAEEEQLIALWGNVLFASQIFDLHTHTW